MVKKWINIYLEKGGYRNKKETKKVDTGVKEHKRNKKETKEVDTGMKENKREKRNQKGIVETPVCRP